ncbi:nucleoside-diphosphate kinase [Blattabacterium cuenoti]|uniref:nucleoside-diphosphate kinase n=1 Tax=Blattabacterium cuenoti TaxID=1653831 RepID=UPI00163C7BF4|nr:nucleoside-diphosphate kinase [Blattabacterium cuenoti]
MAKIDIFPGNFTLSIIKPDAIENGYISNILIKIMDDGFKITAIKTITSSKKSMIKFYEIHEKKSFFNSLINFMSSAPIIPMILKKKNAVKDFRKLIGNTNPLIAKKGTIRNLYATSLEKNAIHGSDNNSNAIRECKFFFPNLLSL